MASDSEVFILRDKVYLLEKQLMDSKIQLLNVKSTSIEYHSLYNVVCSEVRNMKHCISELNEMVCNAEIRADIAEVVVNIGPPLVIGILAGPPPSAFVGSPDNHHGQRFKSISIKSIHFATPTLKVRNKKKLAFDPLSFQRIISQRFLKMKVELEVPEEMHHIESGIKVLEDWIKKYGGILARRE
ncbi:WPP domain interacting tail-anchored protein, putative [Medicago truncatula]|uniref:WPP domain interacting tail-anchored protein, putative n=1 Tax=Medicago truncatula TaxID=3880 RepID=G7IQZ3_MEDTR|nr:WPP domain interacting tail-anchored protein, putative [Medicago truncatula]